MPKTTSGPTSNLRSQLKDKAKHTAALIQEITEELQAIEEESSKDDQDTDATQVSDLEQEDSDITPTEDEQWLCDNDSNCKTNKQDNNRDSEIRKSNQEINHTEEVIVGTEQGTTFPTKIETSICNTLIDTGVTKSSISERYYQQLPSIKLQKLRNISVRSATGSNLIHLGMIHCSFELGKIKFNSNLIICRNLTWPLILGRDFLLQHHITVCYAVDGKCNLDYQQQELVASIDIEDKPQLNMTHSVTVPGRTLAIVCVCNNLDPNQSGSLYEIEPNKCYMKSTLICVLFLWYTM